MKEKKSQNIYNAVLNNMQIPQSLHFNSCFK